MKSKKIIAFSLFVVFTLSIIGNVHALAINDEDRVSKILSTNTIIESDIFAESAELFAGRNQSLIAQVNYVGGNHDIPFDLTAPEFEHLEAYILYAGDQHYIKNFWPRALAELRDGLTLVLNFKGITYSQAIDNAETIKAVVESEYGLELQPLFGYNLALDSTIAYYKPLAAGEMNAFLASGWAGSPYNDGLASFSSATTLQNSPAKITAHLLTRTDDTQFPSGWMPINIAAFVAENAITIDENDIYTLSLKDVFGFTDVQGSVYSNYSLVKLRMPYIANVYSVDPITDNLYPEITGNYYWTLRASISALDWLVEASYDDIELVYDLNTTDFSSFPQIESVRSIDSDLLANNNILNYSISITNNGDETAKNLLFAEELGERPESFTTPIFDSETYYFDNLEIAYYNSSTGIMTEIPVASEFNITFNGWYKYVENNSIVQPVTTYNVTTDSYDLDIEATFASVHTNKTFFTFEYSSNFVEVEDLYNGTQITPNFGLVGSIESLEPGETVDMWWSIGNLPSHDDIINVFDFNIEALNISHTYIDTILVNFTVIDTVSIADYIIDLTVSEGWDLRLPPGMNDIGWLSGSKFRYEDLAGREFFGLSNGLGIQLYDEEAILVTTVSTDKTYYRVGDDIEVTFNIENIGDETATNVEITGYHAYMQANWQLGDVYDFYSNDNVADLAPGESVNVTWSGKANTFLGIQPVFAGVSYTTEEGDGDTWDGEGHYTNVLSSLVNLVVLPPEHKDGVEEPSFPTPEVLVETSVITDGELQVGDTIEVHTEITNIGDEATHLVIVSYFWNKYLSLVNNAYTEGTVKVTDDEGNVISGYDQGYVNDDVLGVTYVGASEITLEPNETIHLYYSVKAEAAGTFTIPPMIVEYDSDYPMDIATGEESTEPENPIASIKSLKMANEEIDRTLDGSRLNAKTCPVFSTIDTWSSSSNPSSGDIVEDPDGEDTADEGVPGFEIFFAILALTIVPAIRKMKKF